MGMSAWSEAAALRSLEHFRKIFRYLLLFQVYQSETAQARSVNNEAS